MHLRLLAGLSVCFFAALAATADDQSFVPSNYLPSALKAKSNFDAWAPSASQRQTYFDHNHVSVWESQHWLNYRLTANQNSALRVVSQPEFAESSSFEPQTTLSWKPLSLDSSYQIWDDLELPIAFAVSVQPRTADENAYVQETAVIGRTYDFWRWAMSFSQGNEWSNRLKERDGDLELGLGIARAIGANWSVGVELRDHSELPEYRRLAGNKVFLGPVVRCHKDNWWMAFSVMPRVLGFDYVANSDTPRDIEFDTNQKLTTRFMFGLCF
ncbi:MAG: hypothetical protein ACXWBP_08410 [Limisphaerales bacterium]